MTTDCSFTPKVEVDFGPVMGVRVRISMRCLIHRKHKVIEVHVFGKRIYAFTAVIWDDDMGVLTSGKHEQTDDNLSVAAANVVEKVLEKTGLWTETLRARLENDLADIPGRCPGRSVWKKDIDAFCKSWGDVITGRQMN